MKVTRTIYELRQARAVLGAGGAGLSLVATMGALHSGHMALVAAARAGGGAVVVSIFVNPMQFGANEDIARYPRQEAADLGLLEQAGCDLVWLPDATAMYPPEDATAIEVAGPARLWEGAQRPGHFRGVATVVAKLLGQIRPTRAFFGEKDWQQLQVVRRVVADLHLPVEIVGVPTVREADGLAMSSRNVYLTQEQRQVAPRLFAHLDAASAALAYGAASELVCEASRVALVASGFEVNYFVVVEPSSLEPVTTLAGPVRLIAAARLGTVRLLDNVAVVAMV